jgi:hypothetical protein
MNFKKTIFAVFLVTMLGCETYEQFEVPSDLTGNSVTYFLQSGSYWNTPGMITFHEKINGATMIKLKVTGIPDMKATGLPVHIHAGDISTEHADIVAHLQTIFTLTGESTTHLTTPYEYFKNMNGSVKVHLSEAGEGRNVVIAAGNIGKAATESNPGGRLKIAVCKSE